jgi:glutamyl-tRNA synthetase
LPFVVRLAVDRAGSITYVDKVFGEVRTPNVEQQDFVLMRADGVPLYNFGVVVDDMTMGITLVARGRDHMINTPPQIMLYQAFGATVPEFAHLPMMLNQKGEKLSKRDGAVGVFEYRDAGYAPHAVLNYLARFGWSHGDQEVFSLDDLVQAFSWEACGRGDGKFDAKKFLAIEHELLKSERLVPDAEYADRVLPFLAQRGLEGITRDAVVSKLFMIRERARTFVEAADMLDYFFRDEPVLDEKADQKVLVKEAAARLRAFRQTLSSAPAWTSKDLEATTNAWLETSGLQMKDVAQPARVALTGRTASPGLFDVLAALGKDRSLERLARAETRADAR